MRQLLKWIPLYALLLVSFKTGYAQPGKISGYMFGDYYYMASNHLSDLESLNGFWFRRIYLTYDQGLSENFGMRFRIEMSSAGDFSSKTKMAPAVKDAYLKWKLNRHSIILGISPTPTWDLVEKVWGYRAAEKTPLDLQKFGSSRDFGLSFRGSLDQKKKIIYHFMIANGNGNSSENNAGKKVFLALTGKIGKNLLAQGYVDFENRPGHTNRLTTQGFAAYQSESFRLGVQFARQTRQREGENDLKLGIGSFFVAAQLSEKAWGFARFDRIFDLNPDGAGIAYIPFDPTAKSTFLLAGLDFRPTGNIHLMPNVEIVKYDENESGVKPGNDIIPRLTYHYIC